jgi:hypothetical protein
MATAVGRAFTVRDVVFSVGRFLPLKDCAAYGAVAKVFRQVATTLGFPQIVQAEVKGDHLVDFAASPLKFRKLAALAIPDLRQATVIPASFNRGAIDELRIMVDGETNQEKIRELIHAMEQVHVLQIREAQSDIFDMDGRFLGEEKRKLSELAVFELDVWNVDETDSLLDLLESSQRITRVALATSRYSNALVELIAQKPLIEEIVLLREHEEPNERASPLRRCEKLTKFAPDDSVTREDLLVILEKNRGTLTHLLLADVEELVSVFPHLVRMPQLQCIVLGPSIIESDLSLLQRIPTLTKLEILDVGVPDDPSPEEVQAFVRTLPRVKSLYVGCNCSIFYAALGQSMTQLTELKVSYNGSLTPLVAAEIAKLANLETLILGFFCVLPGNGIVSIIQQCEKLTYLRYEGFFDYAVFDEIQALVANRKHPLRFNTRGNRWKVLNPSFVQWKGSHPEYTKLILDTEDPHDSNHFF